MTNPATIQRLIKHLDARYAEKERYESLEEKRTARQRLIDSVPDVQLMEFYCKCHGDFISKGGKIVCHKGQPDVYAYYVSHGTAQGIENPRQRWHACRVKRYITDKVQDPYYRESKLLNELRLKMADDLLQPDDPKFKAKYGDPYKKFNDKKEADEKAQWEANKFQRL